MRHRLAIFAFQVFSLALGRAERVVWSPRIRPPCVFVLDDQPLAEAELVFTQQHDEGNMEIDVARQRTDFEGRYAATLPTGSSSLDSSMAKPSCEKLG